MARSRAASKPGIGPWQERLNDQWESWSEGQVYGGRVRPSGSPAELERGPWTWAVWYSGHAAADEIHGASCKEEGMAMVDAVLIERGHPLDFGQAIRVRVIAAREAMAAWDALVSGGSHGRP